METARKFLSGIAVMFQFSGISFDLHNASFFCPHSPPLTTHSQSFITPRFVSTLLFFMLLKNVMSLIYLTVGWVGWLGFGWLRMEQRSNTKTFSSPDTLSFQKIFFLFIHLIFMRKKRLANNRKSFISSQSFFFFFPSSLLQIQWNFSSPWEIRLETL